MPKRPAARATSEQLVARIADGAAARVERSKRYKDKLRRDVLDFVTQSEAPVYSADVAKRLDIRVGPARNALNLLEKEGLLLSETRYPAEATSGLGRKYFWRR